MKLSRAIVIASLLLAPGCSKKQSEEAAPVPAQAIEDQPGAAKDAASDSPKGEEEESRSPVASFEADALLEKMTAEGDPFNKKYDGSFVEVTGIAGDFGHSTAGPFIGLQSKTSPADAIVQCITEGGEPWATASPGRTVKAVGKYMAWAPNALLQSCTFEVTGDAPPPPTMTVADLVALHAKRKGVESTPVHMIVGPVYIVEGVVESVDQENTEVVLATKPVRVYVHWATDMGDTFKNLKPGQAIRAIGLERVFSDKVGIAMSELVSQP